MARRLLGVLLASVAAAPAAAHHSFSAEFEADKTAELTGTIAQVWWNNPHIRYRLAVTGEGGATEDWELQAASITAMQQLGWKPDTLKVGDALKVSGQVGRNGAKKLYVRSIERPDGTKIVTGRGDATGPDPNEVHATPGKAYGYGAVRNNYPVDMTGPWRNRYKWRVTVDDLEPKPTPFTAEGRALFAATDHYQDPALRCLELGLPRLFGAPYNMEIVDAGTHYVQIYVEHNTPRRIWMDGRQAPADTPPSSLGFSVGHWEDRTLVVETTHLLPGWLDGSGLPMKGEGTRIVERYELAPDGLSMDRIMTIHDPYYTQPLVRRRGSARDDAGVDISEQASCDPDSYYRDLLELGRLEQHLNGR
jgi:hypothetical protein